MSAETTHTPGPWEVTRTAIWGGVREGYAGDEVLSAENAPAPGWESYGPAELVFGTPENKALVLAAPDLLAAADYAAGQWFCGEGEHRDAAGRNWVPEACPGCRLRAAIQKATTP